jgi:hypothetical protein
MQKDIISKEILKETIKDISKYILNIELNRFEFIDKEFERIEGKRADIVLNVDNNYILHLEIQSSYDHLMPYRMLRYWLDIKLLNKKLPIKQYLINLSNKNIRDNIEELTYKYKIVNLKDLDCNYFLNQDNPHSIILAILCDFKDQSPDTIITHIIQKIHKLSKDEQSFRNHMLKLEELSTLRDLKETFEEIEMRLSEVRVEDLPSYNIGMRAGKNYGFNNGFEEGIVKMIKGFNIPIEEVAKKLKIDKEKLIKELKKNNK